MLRGLALMLDGNPEKAVEVFDAVIAREPDLVEARFNRGVALLKAGDHARAAAAFAAIARDESAGPLRASAAYHQALTLQRAGRSADAETWLERSLSLDPTFDSSRLLLGSLRETRGDVEGAAKAYLEYLKTNPNSSLAALRLARCAQRAGRTDVALTYLRRVIGQAPRSAEAAEARKFLVMWE